MGEAGSRHERHERLEVRKSPGGDSFDPQYDPRNFESRYRDEFWHTRAPFESQRAVSSQAPASDDSLHVPQYRDDSLYVPQYRPREPSTTPSLPVCQTFLAQGPHHLVSPQSSSAPPQPRSPAGEPGFGGWQPGLPASPTSQGPRRGGQYPGPPPQPGPPQQWSPTGDPSFGGWQPGAPGSPPGSGAQVPWQAAVPVERNVPPHFPAAAGPAPGWTSPLPGNLGPSRYAASGWHPGAMQPTLPMTTSPLSPTGLYPGGNVYLSPAHFAYPPHDGGSVNYEEVEALARRVKDVITRCNRKLNDSRAGIQDMTAQRDGFAEHLREAEHDFYRMGLDWRSIEEELKHVRETLIKDANMSPRVHAKLLESIQQPGSPRRSHHVDFLTDADPKSPALEEADPSGIAAILSAAEKSAHPDAILEASRAAAGRSPSPANGLHRRSQNSVPNSPDRQSSYGNMSPRALPTDYGSSLGHQERRSLFSLIDTNHDSMISREEWNRAESLGLVADR